MATLPPDVRRILEEQGILPREEQAAPGGVGLDVLREMGLLPQEQEEGWDVFQPIRTVFSGTGGAVPAALAPLAPTQYAAARAELEKSQGVSAASPWYERAEALPGLGDVAAQFIPQEIRDSRLGTALGGVGRLAGNILGDPTTYTPFVLGRATGAIARSVPEAGTLIGRAAGAEVARRSALGAAPLAEGAIGPGLTRRAADAARAAEAADISRAVMQHGNVAQRAGFMGGSVVQGAEPAVMGTAAALAYGPAAVAGAYEGWKEAASGITEEPILDTAAQTANALLQTGLSALMANGLISGVKAAETWQRHLREQRPADTKTGVDEVGGAISEAVEDAAMPIVPGIARTEAGIPTAEPIEGAPIRVGEAAPLQAEPITGVRRVASAGEPQLLDEGVSLIPEELPVVEGRLLEPLAPDVARFIEKNGGPETVTSNLLQRRFRVGRSQAEAWLADAAETGRSQAPDAIPSKLEGEGTAPRPPVNEPITEAPPRAPELVEPPVVTRAPIAEVEPRLVEGPPSAQLAEPRVTDQVAARPQEPVAGPSPIREPLAVRPEPPVEPRAAEPAIREPAVAKAGEDALPKTLDEVEAETAKFIRTQLDAADDVLTRHPVVLKYLRSVNGIGSQKGKNARPDKAANLASILIDKDARAGLVRRLQKMQEEAAAKGIELYEGKIHALLGEVSANRGLLKPDATRDVRDAKRFDTALQKAEAGAEGPAGKAELRSATRNHYDFLKEQLTTEGSPLQRAGLKKVSELIEALALDKTRFPARYVDNFKEYVAARERGLSDVEALKVVQEKHNAAVASEKESLASLQATRNVINKVFREADKLQKARGLQAEGAVRGQVEGKRDPTPEELNELAAQRQTIIQQLREAQGEELAVAATEALAYLQRRKIFSTPGDKPLMAELKKVAEKVGVKLRKQNAEELVKDIVNKLGITVPEVKPTVDRILEPVREAAVKKVRAEKKEGGRGPGGGKGLPTHPSRPGHGWFELPNKTQLQFLESEGRVSVTKFDDTNLAGVRKDLAALREDPDIKQIDVGDLPNKALDGLLDPAEGRLPAFVEDPDAPGGIDRLVRMEAKQDRIAEMAAREATGGVHPSWLEPVSGKMNTEISVSAWKDDIGETLADNKKGPLLVVKSQLEKLGIKGVDLNDPLGELGEGTYHVVYDLKGAKDADGNGYVLRVGKAPYIPLKSAGQKALMQDVVLNGVIGEHGGLPVYYTVHPKGVPIPHELGKTHVTAVDESGKLSGALMHVDPRIVLGPEFKKASYDRLAQLYEGQLPGGRTLREFFDDAGLLLHKASLEGMDVAKDVFTYEKRSGLRNPWGLKSNQFAYFPVKALDTQGVGFVDRTGQAWQLKAIDLGLLSPGRAERLSDPVLHQIHETWRIAQQATLPESRLTLDEKMRQITHYVEDAADAEELANGLRNANHDRIASEGFVARHGELGASAAAALREIVDDVTRTVNDQLSEGDRRLNVQYRGLTSSPFLSGLYHERVGSDEAAHIYSNVVEAVNAADGSYERAVENLLNTVLHEVTHNKHIGHGSEFQTFSEYKRNVLTAAGKLDEYRAQLKAAFTEEQFRTVEEGLVPEFQRMRRAHGNRAGASWTEAQRREAAVEGVPPGAVAGRAPPVTDRLAGGEEGAPLDLRGRQEPGGVVPRGGGIETGRVRPAAAAGAAPAAKLAEGEAARPAAGGDPLQAIKERIAEYGARVSSEQSVKELLHSMVEGARKVGTPPSHADVHNWAYALAGDLTDVMHPKDLELRANSVRRTPKEGQVKGPINLVHLIDLPVKTKARIQIWYDLTKDQGLWPEDRPQRWQDVEKDVHEAFGLHTPEQWAQHFRNQQGGPTARDVLLVRQVAEELSRKVERAEELMYDQMATNPDLTPEGLEKLQQAVNAAHQSAVEGVLTVAQIQQKAGRALAIFKKDIRAVDPQLAFQQDFKAGLRERMQTRFKGNTAAAEEAASKLFNQFMEIRNSPNPDWSEFQKAYRAVMGSKLWPEKILEFYKGGLLSWPSRVANMTSNGLLRGVRMVEDAVAAGLDAAESKLTGAERERFLGEGSVSMMALRRAWSEAIPEWWGEMKRNAMLKPDDMTKAMAKGSLMEDLLQGPGAIPGKTGEFLRFHLKGMGADDAFAKHFVRTDNLYRQIYRKLRQSDKNFPKKAGESLATATERIFSDMMGNWQQALDGSPQYDYGKVKLWAPMMDQAKKEAERETFQAELGPTAQAGQSFLRNNPIFQIFIPFYRTPVNITKETLVRTPLGFLNTAKKWKDLSPAERTGELSKNITGTLLGAGALAYAMADGASGGGPLDPDERAMLESTGWQPYSVKIGNNYVSYQRLEPLASLLGVASDAAEGLRNGDFQSAKTGFMRVMQSAAENITNKTFLSGLDALSSAISHPNQFGNSFVKRMQSSIIPNSLGFVPVSGLARAMDATYRQSEPMSMSAFYQKLPFLSSTLEPQYSPSGAERQRPGTAFERVFSPFARTERGEGFDRIGAEEVVRLAASPKAPRKYWLAPGGLRVDFLPEERKAMAQSMEAATKFIGERLIRDPNYLALPDNEMDPKFSYGRKTKETVLKDVYGRYRDRVMQRIKPQLVARGRKKVRES